MREFFSILGLVFLAELADKTQLTVLGLSTGQSSPWTVFFASSLALILSTGLAVVVGDAIQHYVPEQWIRYVVGGLFVAIGAWYMMFP